MTEKEVIQKLEAGDKNFEICNLSGLDLGGLNFKGTNLRGANLRGADLRHTNLSGADLRHTNLSDADLSDADLRHTNLSDANLCGANLCGANLRGANLSGANIDYACWPLWCGGLHVKIDKRIACQLAYHLCNQNCDDPEYIEARNAILNFANQFHRAAECGLLEPRNTR